MLGVALLLLAVGVGFFVRGWVVGRDDPPANQALIDEAASEAVIRDASVALTSVFSYDYTAPDAIQAAADDFLVGDARQEFDVLLKTLLDQAPGQKLTLSAEVSATGVKSLTDDSAELLMFLDQRSERSTDSEVTVSAAMLTVQLRLVGGAWRVAHFDTL
ncbi:hypothetical protein NODU109028_15680 [Nocardioides dubius]